MLTFSILVLYSLCFSIATQGSSILPQWDLEIVQKQTSGNTEGFARRYDSLVTPLDLDPSAVSLTVNVTLGTPPRILQFLLEIAQGDTNVLSKQATICQKNGCPYGAFDQNSSSTYKATRSNFTNNYGDGTYGDGIYATDTLNISGTSVNAFQFGLSTVATNPYNILGLGYPGFESNPDSYVNLPGRLANILDLPLTAFSIWFDGKDFKSGKLAFGGVDTGKFSGALQTVTVPPGTNTNTHGYILLDMDNVITTIDGQKTTVISSSSQVVIDTGTSFIYLPDAVVTTLQTLLGGIYYDSAGYYIQAYADMKNGSSLGFTFAGATINVPVAQLSSPGNATHGIISISNTSSTDPGSIVLGLVFLRSAYVVVDYTHNLVSFQQTVYNPASNVTAIPALGVQGLQSTFNTTTTSPANSSATTNPSSSQSGSPTPKPKLSSAEKIGIGVGVGLGVPLLLLLGAILFLRRRKQQQRKNFERPASASNNAATENHLEKPDLPIPVTHNSENAPAYHEKSHEDRYSNAVTELPGSPRSPESPTQQHDLSAIDGSVSSNFKQGPLSEYYESDTTARNSR